MLTWMGGSSIERAKSFRHRVQRLLRSEALKIVLDTGVPITMVGLDVTRRVLVEAPSTQGTFTYRYTARRLVLDWLGYYGKLHRRP